MIDSNYKCSSKIGANSISCSVLSDILLFGLGKGNKNEKQQRIRSFNYGSKHTKN